jgi:hypothetical protein
MAAEHLRRLQRLILLHRNLPCRERLLRRLLKLVTHLLW